ncbi:MAG TPA: Wzz/FepE/Etk N-terminal domain-containing protein [Candidatus Sulfotelmatobacter sp.]|nr:Wzz/FepE/Etk N-terminal domain-containing protein [Candidatus Sulfotelmatobacter sp.]
MIANRALDLDDYLAIVRRHLRLICFSTLLITLIGFLASFAFSPQYTSRALVVVERQTIPAGYVQPIVTTSVIDRIAKVQQQVLSRSRLEAVVNRLGLARTGKSVDEVIDNIQRNISFVEADPSTSQSKLSKRNLDFLGFYIRFVSENPQEAQQVCAEITSIVLAENTKMREQVAVSTADFLGRQLADAKTKLDQKDREFAEFKSKYLGQLPGDVDRTLAILNGLNAQLEGNTQALTRAEQDKSYAESLLDEQVAAWKSSQFNQTTDTIGQRLVALRTQLITMQNRYTEDYPDVIKAKSEIKALEAKQKQMDESGPHEGDTLTEKGKAEPAQILQLRERIRQAEAMITRATQRDRQLQTDIHSYQNRLTLSPKVEEEYRQLTRDNEVAHKLYDTLLSDKGQSEIQTDMERSQQGEQLRLLDAANLPDSPSFPVRWKFAAGGFGGGLALAAAITFLLELRDKSIRDEKDVVAALELPMLTSVPWLNPTAAKRWDGFGGRLRSIPGR